MTEQTPATPPAELARHFMLPGSHERPGGAECRCGQQWFRWEDACGSQLTATVCPHEDCAHPKRPEAADCGNHEEWMT